MIEVRYKGRLGNNMFQYCLGRLLAEQLGFALQAEPISAFPNTAQDIGGARHQWPEQILTGHRINFNEILADRSPRRIVLDGWFQRYEYYREHRDRIRDWLTFDQAITTPNIENKAVVVNVRRTDYVGLGWALPFAYYEAALNHLMPKPGEVCIVTDDRRDPFFNQFSSWKPRFFSGTPAEQMMFMAKAPQLVISQSTFSWWPAFLGDPKVVVCSTSPFGAWPTTGGEIADVNLIERDRFVCIPSHIDQRPTPAELRYQARRAFVRRVVLSANRRLRLSIPEPAP